MTRIRVALIAALCAVGAITAPARAQEVLDWVDETGVIRLHFADQGWTQVALPEAYRSSLPLDAQVVIAPVGASPDSAMGPRFCMLSQPLLADSVPIPLLKRPPDNAPPQVQANERLRGIAAFSSGLSAAIAERNGVAVYRFTSLEESVFAIRLAFILATGEGPRLYSVWCSVFESDLPQAEAILETISFVPVQRE